MSLPPAPGVPGRYALAAAPRRIGLLGPYASRNLGDAAIQAAVVAELRARLPGAALVGICPDPEDTVRTLRIPAFPLSGHGGEMRPDSPPPEEPPALAARGRVARLRAACAAAGRIASFVQRLDLLVVSGGGQLDDYWGGAWQQPYALALWTSLARLHGVRVAVLGVGLDRLSTRLSRFFTRTALDLAQFRSFRDPGTLAALRADGFRRPARVCPDLAFGLPPALVGAARAPGGPPFAVVSPISDKVWLGAARSRYDAYVEALAAACGSLAGAGLRVRLACSQSAMDAPVASRLAERVRAVSGRACEIGDAATVQDYVGLVRGARVVIASRLHAVILALVAGAPVVAVSYARKVAQLMRDLELGEYCVDLGAADAEALARLAALALAEDERLREHIRRRTSALRAALGETYDAMLDTR